MLDPISDQDLAAFKARKLAQWERMASGQTGLQMIQSGERATQFSMATEIGGVHEAVVFGQLPHVVTKRIGSLKNPVLQPALDHEKPHDKRAIDLSDDDIGAVLSAWCDGRSARGLPNVPSVYRNGVLVSA